MELMQLPLYVGFESSYEDIVYSFFRKLLNDRGYSFKVKRTGFWEIDGLLPSYSSGKKGRGSCDGYIFSASDYASMLGLIELETTGKLDQGISQIRTYAQGFSSKKLTKEEVEIVKQIKNRELYLIVFDGQILYLSTYNLDSKKETIIFNKISVPDNRISVSRKLIELFPGEEALNRETDEKAIISEIAKIIRGHEKLQRNKALLMTILASMYGATKQSEYAKAESNLKSSQVEYDVKLYDTFQKFTSDITDSSDLEKIPVLYEKTASKLFELSQDRGMDLYGFIYEELASKESKKEQGEYYTPRRTIRPLIRGVYNNYLNWSEDELEDKIVFDPFCGSGGFLYEYISFMKSKFGLNKKKIDNIAQKSIWGVDKNIVLAAYLNLFLVGDGSANIHRVKTSINWRRNFMYGNSEKDKFKVKKITDPYTMKFNLKNSNSDLNVLYKMYIDKKYQYDIDKQFEYFQNDNDPLSDFLLSESSHKEKLNPLDYYGCVDLLLTNIPYGKVTEANEQFIENGTAIYGNSLEANGLRECIDFLKPAKLKNGKVIEEGGIALVIVPDCILENPSHKAIRDYMISRCNILSIIGLPPYTFAPYAMEKTYAIVMQKIAPECFDYQRALDVKCFMYYSLCDGKANSQNRYRTDLLTKANVNLPSGKSREVVEFLHNDFEPCFDSFEEDQYIYKSKLEWAWDYTFASKNLTWDQLRITENWTERGWKKEVGQKWGYFDLVRYEREIEKTVKMNSLEEKIKTFLSKKISEGVDIEESYLGEDNYLHFCSEFIQNTHLSPKEKAKLETLTMIKRTFVLGDEQLQLIVLEKVPDVDLNPDSPRYLGKKELSIDMESVFNKLQSMAPFTESQLVDFFRNKFTSERYTTSKLLNNFDIIQGVQFSKRDAYLHPGSTPVFTAATNGPAYYVDETIPNKVKVKGPSLIWSRKGAKAGTIQLFDQSSYFFISDVSGTIRPKEESSIYSLTFFKYYIAGQVRRELQSKSNNAQLNKSKLENLQIYMPDDTEEIGKLICASLID
ncbi:MAG: N-6 DNA methylase [Gemmiger sp.]|uniref:N-6 DNA methylase n=1 Tax=Gemmiger sp. TaxID=2049027 RepID=UPI0026666E48|nr:N-6 DNA methylase [Gemmiger sp.]MEE0709996.1 N-6 DNA methylase [Gemmiger sp.]